MDKNASILVVDDDKEIADLVEIYLVNDGYKVLKASDGEQCLSMLAEHPEIRMLILDIMMPGHRRPRGVAVTIRKTSQDPDSDSVLPRRRIWIRSWASAQGRTII